MSSPEGKMHFQTAELIGLSEVGLVEVQGQRLRRELLLPLAELQQHARAEGFELTIASAYRSYQRQQHIWDQKARGLRPLLSDSGLPLDFNALTDGQRLEAILRWSALPGASRHHWGTDFDVFDAAALAPGQNVQLTVEETTGGGPFASMHRWLDEYLARPQCPFFRPYVRPYGGVAPEPWHLSFAPVASQMQQHLNCQTLHEVVEASEIALKDLVLQRLPDIFERFVWVPWELYPQAFRGDNADNF